MRGWLVIIKNQRKICLFVKEWKKFYQIDEILNVNQSYSLHLWGKHSSHIPLENLKKGTLLYQLASKHCPYTIESAINLENY